MGVVDGWRVVDLTPAHVQQLITWRYPEPYDRYDLGDDADALVDPASCFVALLDADDELVGLRSFGPDGRVVGGAYDDTALDTGGGLRPDLTGRGLGRAAMELGLAHGRRRFDPTAFRVTVWAGNARALSVVRAVGFAEVSRFESTRTGEEYLVLVRPER
jgi:RimJ/RimL family protein N-acetyltransferase